MRKEETYIVTTQINGTQARNELKQLETRVKDVRKEMDKAYSTGDKALGDKLAKDLKKAQEEMRRFKIQTRDVSDILNSISDASLNQLQKASKTLTMQMRNLSTSTEEFKEKAEQLRTVKARLREIREEGRGQQSWIMRTVDGFNRIQGAAIAAVGAITGLTMTIRKTTNDYAEMEEAMADVQKYTGQSSEEVHEMNEEFKKMNTRTVREKLNALAGDAGRLGITVKESIQDFVEAGDIINVALGDDLGDEAVKNIGKLAMTFGDDKKKGLRGAMLGTGSAVNELAQSSSASAGYIVDFTARLAGVSTQAEIAQTQVMGFASVLDQNMQQEETAATALSQLIAKLFQEPEKFAKLAGKSVDDFSRLLRTDANEALLQFFDAMSARGGFDALAPMFEEMGLSGTRCVGVLSVLANKLDDVREAQEIAKNAFEEGTSVVKEFGVQDNTVQARLDKRKNQFRDISIELGEKLLPVVRYTISSTSLLVKALLTLIKFTAKYGWTIASITVSIIAYNVALKASNIAFKAQYYWLTVTQLAHKAWAGVVAAGRVAAVAYNLVIAKMTGNVSRAAAAQRVLNSTMKANVLVALASAIMTVAVAVAEYFASARKATKATAEMTAEQKRQKKEQSLLGNSADALVAKFNRLQTQYKNLKSTADKNKWIRDNQSAFQELGVSVNKVNDAENVFVKNASRVIAALKAVAEARAYSEMYEEAVKKQAKNERKTGGRVKYQKAQNGNLTDEEKTYLMRQGYNGYAGKYGEDALQAVNAQRLANARKTSAEVRKVYDEEVEYYEKKMNSANEKAMRAKDTLGSANTVVSSSPSDKDAGKAEEERLKRETEEERRMKEAVKKSKEIARQQEAINSAEYARGEKLYADYVQRKQDIAIEALERELAIYKKGSEEYNTTIEELKKATAEQNMAVTKLMEEDIDRETEVLQDKLKTAYHDPLSLIYNNEQAYEQALFQITYEALKKKRDLHVRSSQEWSDLNRQMTDADNENTLKNAKEFQERLEEFKKEYLGKSADEQKRMELAFAKELYDRLLLSEEQYQEAKRKIKEKYKQEVFGFEFSESSFDAFATSLDNLKNKIDEGKATWKDYASVATSSLNVVMGLMGALADLTAATAQAEIATVEAKYDKEIEAAGKNKKKVDKLEKQKKRETNKIKEKQINSDAKINTAQVLINTALSIAKGYADYGPILGSVLAALSVTMGGIQMATIQAQKEAQLSALQYYEGGFTGGKQYRKEAGVVHEGEFVANHKTVNNPNILPILRMIDEAQRNNTSASLTVEDLRSVTGASSPAAVVAPVVNVTTDNAELNKAIAQTSEAVSTLNDILAEGITAYSVIDGPNGSYQQTKRYERLLKNK